ncbi:hypothetical protein [Acidisoma cladoniae]|jgi:hypothetical protein|uniref:hypothetical protein n=1 Tax=Acidisoma cladoniae TaxID=3040935 RepID=UPI0033142910
MVIGPLYWSCATSVRRYAADSDPLVQLSNWAALTVGSHLPFWPLYIWWAAGRQAFPTSLLTVSLTPLFLAMPWLSRRSSLYGRIGMPLVGIGNTILTVWILGENSGTGLFLAPCAVLAVMSFRYSERWIMLCVGLLPVVVYYVIWSHPPVALHNYDPGALRSLFELNALSVGVLIVLFGWFRINACRSVQASGGRRMQR